MGREGLMDDCGYNFDVDEDSYNSGFKDGFLTAIDEFAEKLREREFDNAYGTNIVLTPKEIDEIAEELKKGE